MAKVTIFQFRYFDPNSGTYPTSRYWGTFDAIAATRIGIIARETAVEEDESLLDENGLSPRDFNPHSLLRGGNFPSRSGG